MIITGRSKPTHLVSRIKKICIWHRRFGHASNARVIWALKLLTGIGDFSENYDPAEIYSNFEAPKLEKSLNSANLIANNPTDTSTAIKTLHGILMKASKITNTNSDFDEICEPYMGSKQTWVIRWYKPMTLTKKKLEKIHINL